MSAVFSSKPWLRFWLMRSAYLLGFVALVVVLAFSGVIEGERRSRIITLAGYLLPLLVPVLMAVDYRHVRAHWQRCNRWGILSGEPR
jgi:hypothetical protein